MGIKKSIKRTQSIPPERRFFRLRTPNIPLLNLPAPVPCPFCGCRDIEIDLRMDGPDGERHWVASAWCEGCGCEKPAIDDGKAVAKMAHYSTEYRTIAIAASRWNDRSDHYSKQEEAA